MCISWPREAVNVTTFGKKVFAEVIKIRISRRDHPGLSKQDLFLMTSCPYKIHKRRDKRRRRPCEDGHSTGSDAATSQGMSRVTKSWKSLERILP